MRSKEEIYEQYIGNGQYGIDFEKKHILEAMDEYTSEVLRDFAQRFYADEEACRNNVENFF